MLGNIITILVGSSGTTPLEQRMVNMAALLACVAGILVTLSNIILGNPPLHNLFAGVAFAAGLIFYWFSRIKKSKVVAQAMFLFFILLLTIGWYPVAGSYGTMPYFFFMVFIFGIIVLRRSLRIVTILLIPVLMTAILTHEFFHPEMLGHYPNLVARYSDMTTALSICMVLSSLLVFLVVEDYHMERKRKNELLIDVLQSKKRLETALAEIKILKGFLPICSGCKKVRDDDGFWQDVTLYISKHTDTTFSHGICPDCTRSLYPEYSDETHSQK